VIVSPEVAISKEFCTAVLSKSAFSQCLHVVRMDEAHCVSLWGGTFRNDYAELGILHGCLLANVPVLIASATFLRVFIVTKPTRDVT
ncbi:hypothetical protein F4604DRAFT_2013623, partial [Suillus subluteus]